jgi:FMN phosphatase YigB (HAD superfamily)
MNILQKFIESDVNAYRIFLDMDGVLVNWDKGYKDALLARDTITPQKVGYDINVNDPWDYEKLLLKYYQEQGLPEKKARGKAKSKFWSIIQGDFNWWINLEWMPDGKELFNTCLDLRTKGIVKQLNILSSPSSDKVCEPGKRTWLENQGIAKHFDNIIIFKEKYKYATGPNDILIDDTPKKINEWNDLGKGTGILHENTETTLRQLREIFKDKI